MKSRITLTGAALVFLWTTTAMATSLVEAEWLKENLNDKNVRIVEVPDKAESAGREHIPGKMHIPGAVVVNRYVELGNPTVVPPTRYPSREQFEKLMSNLGIDPDTTVVVYDDKYGLFASRLLVIMELYGHDIDKLKLLNGGLVRWKKLGYPLQDGHLSVKPTRYRAGKANPMLLTWSEVYNDTVSGARPEVILLDVRPADEYSGKNVRCIRGGHIPHAVNVTGTDAVNKEDHTFKPVEEIRAMFEAKGIVPNKPVYEYCHSGDRAAHAYIILKHFLGYPDVKLYDGSWLEWSTTLSLPAEDQTWFTSAN